MQGAGKAEANVAFDAAFLDIYTGGDKGLRNQVLEMFLAQSDLLLSRLKDARGNPKAWHEAAHSLKGCASGVGANGLAGLAREAEQQSGASADRQDLMIRDLSLMIGATSARVRELLGG